MLTPKDMPAPDALIQYDDGTICAAMFHFMASETPFGPIADEHGFEVRYLSLADDVGEEHPVWTDYYEGGNRWMKEWHPTPPDEGWAFGGVADGEEGPCAIFLRVLQDTPHV